MVDAVSKVSSVLILSVCLLLVWFCIFCGVVFFLFFTVALKW